MRQRATHNSQQAQCRLEAGSGRANIHTRTLTHVRTHTVALENTLISCDPCTSETQATSQTSAKPGLQFIYDYRLYNTHSTCWVNVSHLIITDKRACASGLIILSSQDHCVLKKQSERYQPSKAGCESSNVRSDRLLLLGLGTWGTTDVIINVCPFSRSSAVIQEVKWAWFRMSSPAGVTLE